MSKPKVSVVTIAYNHELYIREALDSFIMQQTNFDFEVIVADDQSTDNTPRIIEEYAERYPNIIKPILRKKNIGAWNNFLDAIRSANSKYIAICEGDDYWTDPNKLQIQVDFMEKHPDYSLCFHPVRVFYENHEEEDSIYPVATNGFTLERLLQGNFIQTNSVIYRRQEYKHLARNIMPGDWYLHLYHAQYGKIGFINKAMSTYRRHAGGAWWTAYKKNDEFWIKYGLPHLALCEELLKIYGENTEHRAIIYMTAAHYLRMLLKISDGSQRSQLIQRAIGEHPEIVIGSIGVLSEQLEEDTQRLDQKEERIVGLEHEVKLKTGRVTALEAELATVKNSRPWKAGQKVRAARNKLKRG